MWRAWKLGSVFDIGIYVHWSFLLAPLYAFIHQSIVSDVASGAFIAGIVFLVFGCIILHELGHALAARFYGIRTRDITLYPIGGLARLERMSEKPIEELVIALAWPAVNVVIAILLGCVLGVALLLNPGFGAPFTVGGLVLALA